MLMALPEIGQIIVLVIDDRDDDELASVIARENLVPSDNFGGLWGSGERDGYWLVAFQLIQLGGGVERKWFTDNIHRPLLEAILDVPHYVSIMPKEIAGDAGTANAIVPRLGGSLMVQVDHRSPQVAEVLAERND
jgi:hypothetical protein